MTRDVVVFNRFNAVCVPLETVWLEKVSQSFLECRLYKFFFLSIRLRG